MGHLDAVTQKIEAIKAGAPDLHGHLSAALGPFRFVPKAERRALADDFAAWADSETALRPATRGAALLVQGMDRFIVEDLAASLQLVSKAHVLFAEASDAEGCAMCDMLTSAIYRTFGNFDLALKTAVTAFEELKGSGRYPVFTAAVANTIANISFERGDLTEALAKFLVTCDESAKANDFYFMIYGRHGLGRIYLRQDRRADAEHQYRRALELAELHKHPLQISNALTELAALHLRYGELDDAERLNQQALALREEHHLLAGAITNCLRLAEIAGKRSNWRNTLPLLERALAVAEELKVKPKIAQVHEQLSIVYEHLGDLVQSLEHYKRFHALREEVEREDSARSLADAKLIFDAEQTRKENVIIREQKAQIERTNVQLQDTIDELTRAKIGRKARAWTLAVVVLLFIFQDAILGAALRALSATHYNTYVVSLVLKMAIIFSLAPISRAIERFLLKDVMRRDKLRRLEAS